MKRFLNTSKLIPAQSKGVKKKAELLSLDNASANIQDQIRRKLEFTGINIYINL